jgi:transcription elongation factor Elf1
MNENQQNRMLKNKAPWEPAKSVQVPSQRCFLCVQCASPRTVVRITRPEENVVQMQCLKCGGKFAVRNMASNPEARAIIPKG